MNKIGPILIIIAFLASAVAAQSFCGDVRDGDDFPMPAARITMIGPNNLNRTAKSGNDGRYCVNNVFPGIWILSITVDGVEIYRERISVGAAPQTNNQRVAGFSVSKGIIKVVVTGKVAENANVVAVVADRDGNKTTVDFDDEGKAQLGGLGSGTYELVILVDGKPAAKSDVKVRVGRIINKTVKIAQ